MMLLEPSPASSSCYVFISRWWLPMATRGHGRIDNCKYSPLHEVLSTTAVHLLQWDILNEAYPLTKHFLYSSSLTKRVVVTF